MDSPINKISYKYLQVLSLLSIPYGTAFPDLTDLGNDEKLLFFKIETPFEDSYLALWNGTEWVRVGGGNNRTELTLATNGSYTMAVGEAIYGIIVDSPDTFNLTIGNALSDGGDATDISITAGRPETISMLIYAKAAKTITFTGIISSTKIIILKNTL